MIRVLLTKIPSRFGPETTRDLFGNIVPRGTGMQVSIWFDGNMYHPLVETVDVSGNVIAGRLIRPNVRLISCIRWAKEWVEYNCPLINQQTEIANAA